MNSLNLAMTIFARTGFGIVLLLATHAGAQANGTSVLNELRSPSPARRMVAFSHLSETERSGAYRGELLPLLLRENRVLDSLNSLGLGTSQELGEGYSEYASRVIEACDRYCDRKDPEVIRALVSSAYNPRGPFARRLAIENGAQVLPTLLHRFNSANVMARESAIQMMATIEQVNDRLSSAHRSLVHEAAIRALADRESVEVRLQGIKILGDIGSHEDLPRLGAISAGDPTRLFGLQGRLIFPLREAATAAIAKIQSRR